MNKKIDDWRSIFADQEASDESGKAYCRAKGIAYSTFSCRRRKLKDRQRPLESGNHAPLVRHSFPKALSRRQPDYRGTAPRDDVRTPSSGDSRDIVMLVKQLRSGNLYLQGGGPGIGGHHPGVRKHDS